MLKAKRVVRYLYGVVVISDVIVKQQIEINWEKVEHDNVVKQEVDSEAINEINLIKINIAIKLKQHYDNEIDNSDQIKNFIIKLVAMIKLIERVRIDVLTRLVIGLIHEQDDLQIVD